MAKKDAAGDGGSARIVMGGIATSTGTDNGDYILGSVVSGTGTFTKTGTGAVTLSGSNTYTGGSLVSAGALVFDGSGALPSTGSLQTSSSSGYIGQTESTGVTDAAFVGKFSTSNSGVKRYIHIARR